MYLAHTHIYIYITVNVNYIKKLRKYFTFLKVGIFPKVYFKCTLKC